MFLQQMHKGPCLGRETFGKRGTGLIPQLYSPPFSPIIRRISQQIKWTNPCPIWLGVVRVPEADEG